MAEARSKRIALALQPSIWEVLVENVENKSEWMNRVIIEKMVGEGWLTEDDLREILT